MNDADGHDTVRPTREAADIPDPWAASTIPVRSHREPGPGGLWRPGDRIDRYELIQQIGAGGMAVVWSARDIDLGREVAIKLIKSSIGWPLPEQRARLLREARAMARLSHPNVVTVHDIGTTEEGLFIVMERLDGGTLSEWLRMAPRTWGEVVAKFIAAGRGLAEAHRAGLVHRDFKPDNVLMGRDGIARVSDFGLAFPVGEFRSSVGAETTIVDGEHPITQDGAAVGTLAYMAPEQLLGETVTPRSDQFSFCIALHEALYAVKPFGVPSGEVPAAVFLSAVVEKRFSPLPPGRAREVPPRLRELTLRGLASDPDDRWPSMKDLVAELERCYRERPRRAWPGAFESLALESSESMARLAFGSNTPTMHAPPPQELLAQAVSAAKRAEALALAVASRQRPSMLVVFVALVLAATVTAIAWAVARANRDDHATAAVPRPAPASQVQAMPAARPVAVAPPDAPPAPVPAVPAAAEVVAPPTAPTAAAVVSTEPARDDRADAPVADEGDRDRRRAVVRRRAHRERSDQGRVMRLREETARESGGDGDVRSRDVGGDQDRAQGSRDRAASGGEEIPAAAPLGAMPARVQEPVEQRTAPLAPSPARRGPMTIPASRVKRESGGNRPIHFPAGEKLPRELVAKLCIDASGSVTSVEVLSRVSPPVRKAVERELSRWRYRPVVEDDGAVAACFATGFPVQLE